MYSNCVFDFGTPGPPAAPGHPNLPIRAYDEPYTGQWQELSADKSRLDQPMMNKKQSNKL